jgi:hypothetical protein
MTKNITILNLPVEKYYNKNNILQVLRKLKQEYYLNELDPTVTFENLDTLIQCSDLIIISGKEVFQYYGEGLIAKIISYYNSGGNIIYEVDPNITEEQNEFLSRFEMSYKGIRLRLRNSYDVPFAMSRHSFRDRYLFKEIDQIILTQPNHIEYWGESAPILISNGSFLSIDAKTDLKSEFPNNEITPIVFKENKNEGLFICVNGFVNINYFSTNEDNDNNLKFLCNLYEMILNKKSRYEIAYTEYRKIEQNLISIVISELKRKNGENWKEMIPIKILENISEKKPQIKKIEEALDFIQLKKIVEYNWSSFQRIFDGNNNLGKKKSLSWMDWVNEKRKDLAHPLKDIKNKGITYDIITELRVISIMLKDKINL